MTLLNLLPFLVVGLLAWYWVDSVVASEFATEAARSTCQQADVQLLDDTVVCTRTRWVRDDDGRLRVSRRYAFEFSDTGNNRRRGWLVLVGRRVELINTGLHSVVDVAPL